NDSTDLLSVCAADGLGLVFALCQHKHCAGKQNQNGERRYSFHNSSIRRGCGQQVCLVFADPRIEKPLGWRSSDVSGLENRPIRPVALARQTNFACAQCDSSMALTRCVAEGWGASTQVEC